MKKNLGLVDRVARIILAIVFAILYFTHVVTGTWGYVLLAIAAILLITSLISFCPLYFTFGLNSGKKEE